MNKKSVIITTIAVALFATGVYALSMKENDKIVASVNGEPVYESEIKNKFNEFISSNPEASSVNYETLDEKVKSGIVRSMLLSDLLDKKAIEAKVEEDPLYKTALKFATMQVRQKTYLDKLTASSVSPDAIKAKYEEYLKEQASKEEYKASHILVKTEEEAKSIEEKIKAGEKFEDLAAKFSIDDTKTKGGDLGFFQAETMVPEFGDAVKALKVGEVSNIVKTTFGYHIIKLLDKKPVQTASFDKMEPELKEKLSQEFMVKYMDDLIKENKVEIKTSEKQ